MNLPAGLLPHDHRIEFFNDPTDREKAYAVTGGVVCRVKDLPAETKKLIWANVSAHPVKLAAIMAMGYHTGNEIIEKYCSCCFGAFDGTADYADGQFNHSEFWNCPIRLTCQGNGTVCSRLTVGQGHVLSPREITVLELTGKTMLNKEIAAHLAISEETVKIHMKNVQRKAGVMNKKDLVLLAHQKNLI